MAAAPTFEELLAEGEAEPVEGWDFSWLDGRATEERPSWGYSRLLGERMAGATAALDIQTGGGEVLSRIPHPPPILAATESWPPNIEVARRNLAPLGASVVQVDDMVGLPFPARYGRPGPARPPGTPPKVMDLEIAYLARCAISRSITSRPEPKPGCLALSADDCLSRVIDKRDEIARQACAAYGLTMRPGASMTPVARGAMGQIWRLDLGAERYALKELLWGADEESVRREAALTAEFAAAGVRLPGSVPARDGRFLVRLATDLGGRWLRLYQWVDGVPADPADPGVAAGVGNLLGRLHVHAQARAHAHGPPPGGRRLRLIPRQNRLRAGQRFMIAEDLRCSWSSGVPRSRDRARARGRLAQRMLELVMTPFLTV